MNRLETISQTDLVETLNALADILEQAKLQPSLHKNNKTQFATLVRDCLMLAQTVGSANWTQMREEIMNKFDYWLSSTEEDSDGVSDEPLPVLELVLEMGIDKMKRDYQFWFVGKKTSKPFQTRRCLSHTIEEIRNCRRKCAHSSSCRSKYVDLGPISAAFYSGSRIYQPSNRTFVYSSESS